MSLTNFAGDYLSSSHIKPKTEFNITYKKANNEDCEQVQYVYVLAGLSDEIISIEQPCNSPEINSQNFKISTRAGDELLIRRCQKLKGLEKYTFLYELFKTLNKEGIRTPEFYSSKFSKLIYLETSQKNQKVCWVFFKYIEAVELFSGKSGMLEQAAEQVGKLHVSLRKYSVDANLQIQKGPFLPKCEWDFYKKMIQAKTNPDVYDELFLQNSQLIEDAIQFVEKNEALLTDKEDIQFIHFDLNSSNFILDKNMQIYIMDFDELKVGNVYTDIGFALHRLLITCLEQNNEDPRQLVDNFLESYQKGNPEIKINLKKLQVAIYDRALRNIKTNLSLRYIENNQDWVGSISLNIQRLQESIALCDLLNP